METSETVEVVETQNNDAEVETQEVDTVAAPEPKPMKRVETPEQKVARLKRELRRTQQQLGIEEEAPAEVGRKPFNLGYAEKAYLNANGVKGPDEYNLVKEYVQNTGKEMDEIIESKYFLKELSELRQTRESKIASDAASGSRMGQTSARDTVDYWIARDQMPPAHMKQLRRDWINAKTSRESSGSPFTDTPVIGQ